MFVFVAEFPRCGLFTVSIVGRCAGHVRSDNVLTVLLLRAGHATAAYLRDNVSGRLRYGTARQSEGPQNCDNELIDNVTFWHFCSFVVHDYPSVNQLRSSPATLSPSSFNFVVPLFPRLRTFMYLRVPMFFIVS